MGLNQSRVKSIQTVFKASYAPTGRAKCAKCKTHIQEGTLRLSRDIPNPDEHRGPMTKHYHSTTACGIAAVLAMKCNAERPNVPKLEIDASVSEKDHKRIRGTFDAAAIKLEDKCRH